MDHDMLNVTCAMDHSAGSAMSLYPGWCFKLILLVQIWNLPWLHMSIHNLVLHLVGVVHSHAIAAKKQLTQKQKVENPWALSLRQCHS